MRQYWVCGNVRITQFWQEKLQGDPYRTTTIASINVIDHALSVVLRLSERSVQSVLVLNAMHEQQLLFTTYITRRVSRTDVSLQDVLSTFAFV
jgi:hypothetical protein